LVWKKEKGDILKVVVRSDQITEYSESSEVFRESVRLDEYSDEVG